MKRSGWHHHNAAIGVFPFRFACEADFLNSVVDDLPFKGVHGGELDWLPTSFNLFCGLFGELGQGALLILAVAIDIEHKAGALSS